MKLKILLASLWKYLIRKEKQNSDCIKATLAIATLLALLCACAAKKRRISEPFVEIVWSHYILFIEGTSSPDEGIVLVDGNISFTKSPNSREYYAEGSGTMIANGVRCFCSEEKIVCMDKEIDLKCGGVIIKRDGSIESDNPLTVLAR